MTLFQSKAASTMPWLQLLLVVINNNTVELKYNVYIPVLL